MVQDLDSRAAQRGGAARGSIHATLRDAWWSSTRFPDGTSVHAISDELASWTGRGVDALLSEPDPSLAFVAIPHRERVADLRANAAELGPRSIRYPLHRCGSAVVVDEEVAPLRGSSADVVAITGRVRLGRGGDACARASGPERTPFSIAIGSLFDIDPTEPGAFEALLGLLGAEVGADRVHLLGADRIRHCWRRPGSERRGPPAACIDAVALDLVAARDDARVFRGSHRDERMWLAAMGYELAPADVAVMVLVPGRDLDGALWVERHGQVIWPSAGDVGSMQAVARLIGDLRGHREEARALSALARDRQAELAGCTAVIDARERMIEALIAAVPRPAWVVDRQGHVRAANQALARALGCEPQTLIGRSTSELRALPPVRALPFGCKAPDAERILHVPAPDPDPESEPRRPRCHLRRRA